MHRWQPKRKEMVKKYFHLRNWFLHDVSSRANYHPSRNVPAQS